MFLFSLNEVLVLVASTIHTIVSFYRMQICLMLVRGVRATGAKRSHSLLQSTKIRTTSSLKCCTTSGICFADNFAFLPLPLCNELRWDNAMESDFSGLWR
jgi:hypothetical protein